MKPFTQNVIEIIKQIPPGYVMTYGQIAELAGSRRGARQVVRILHAMSGKYKLPWHRVVNARGEIALKEQPYALMQRQALLDEGICLDADNRIALEQYRFVPSAYDLDKH